MASITLHSPLDPVAVARKLKDVVRDRLSEDSPGQITGNGTEQRMTLWVHHQHVTNSFRTLFTAKLTADAGGTRIDGRMGPARAVMWLMGCWLLFPAVFLAIGGVIALVAGAPLIVAVPFILVPLGMLAFGPLLWWLGRRTGTADGAEILAFLEKTIDARPIPDAAR